MSECYIWLIKVDLKLGNVSICAYKGAIKNIKFSSMTLLDLYKLPDLDKRAGSCTVSVCIYPVSGQRAIQLVQSVNEVR